MSTSTKSPKVRRVRPVRRPPIRRGGSDETITTPEQIVLEKPVVLEKDKTEYDGVAWKVLGSEGNQYLEFDLKQGQTVIANKHALVYMMDGIEQEVQVNGLWKGIQRKLTGENLFMSYFTNKSEKHKKPRKLCVSLPLKGDVIHIRLNEGEEWKISGMSFLGSSSNVAVSGTWNLRGIFSYEGFGLTHLKAVDGPADVWLCSDGHSQRHEVPVGEQLIVTAGNFLACPNTTKYTLKKVSGILGFLSGADLLAMKFKGPCVVYTHTGNSIHYMMYYLGLMNEGVFAKLFKTSRLDSMEYRK
jgi:uncharacterized protein (AIM24 family)